MLNTHCHLDHVFGNYWVHKNYGLELFIHEGEQPVLEFAPASGNMYGLSFTNYKGNLHFLNEGDKIYFGDDEFEILFTPGHSPASICFYCKAQNFLIGGDVLFNESIGRFDLPGGNEQQLYKSIREKLYVLPDETIVYPGHGEPTTIGHEKKYNPFVRLRLIQFSWYMSFFTVNIFLLHYIAHRFIIYFTFCPRDNIEVSKGTGFITVFFKMFYLI